MSIFMVQYDLLVGEDNSGRDRYEEAIYWEAGYFTTAEAAGAYIAEQHAIDELQHEKLMERHRANVISHNDKMEKKRQDYQKVLEFARENGVAVSPPHFGWAPIAPRLEYSLRNAEVVEIEKHS